MGCTLRLVACVTISDSVDLGVFLSPVPVGRWMTLPGRNWWQLLPKGISHCAVMKLGSLNWKGYRAPWMPSCRGCNTHLPRSPQPPRRSHLPLSSSKPLYRLSPRFNLRVNSPRFCPPFRARSSSRGQRSSKVTWTVIVCHLSFTSATCFSRWLACWMSICRPCTLSRCYRMRPIRGLSANLTGWVHRMG